jgi:ABC-type uncharacterized transport system substrate-binding protein
MHKGFWILGFRLLSVFLLTTDSFADAQQANKVPRIGLLSGADWKGIRLEAFRRRLRELGYIEGKNIILEYRDVEGKLDRVPELMAELIHLKVDVIVTSSTVMVRAAKKATQTIPIVFAGVSDPVESGLVASLARPGGNVTGLTNLAPQLGGKRLELLKEVFPEISCVATLWSSVGTGLGFRGVKAASEAAGLQLQSLEVRSLNDFEGAFEAAIRERAQALLVNPHPLINISRTRILEFAARNRMPAMYHVSEFVDAGGLMSYGEDFLDRYRRVATYVDKILKGANPGNLPIEQPTKFEFVINLKTAKALGFTIPPQVLMEADRVIK